MKRPIASTDALSEPTLDDLSRAPSETPPRDASLRYEVLREVARGGLGRILEARDTQLDRPVAIKELLRSSPILHARFTREALVTARLQHPAIVPVYETGTWADGEPFYVMRLVAGAASIEQAVAARPDLERRLSLVPNVLAVAEAIAYAHGQRIIHRDLKPSNVLVGSFGETVVIDWGLAKQLDDASRETPSLDPASSDARLTQLGAIIGTPAYMAPEQARGEVVSESADIYSLGALLYHVLAGAPPFEGETSQTVLERVRCSAPTPLGTRVPEAPRDLVAIVEKAMAGDAPRRYPTAEALLADLMCFQNGQLVAARRYDRSVLFRRWLGRHRGLLGAVLVALACAAGGAFGSYVISERAHCAFAEAGLAGAWDEAVRGRLRQIGSSPRAEALFDGYARRWQAEAREVCRTVAAAPDERQAYARCFADRKQEVGALAAAFIQAPATEHRLVDLASAIAELASCSTLDGEWTISLPPVGSERRQHLDHLRPILAEASAARAFRDQERVIALLEPRRAEVAGLGEPILQAEWSYRLGVARRQRLDSRARPLLIEAYVAAERAGSTRLRALVAVALANLHGVVDRDASEAERWQQIAEAIVSHLATSPISTTTMAGQQAMIASLRGQHARAEAVVRAALAREPSWADAPAETRARLLPLRQRLAVTVARLSRLSEAKALYEELLRDAIADFGPQHEIVGRIYTDACVPFGKSGDLVTAVRYCNEALSRTTSRLGRSQVLLNLGLAYLVAKDYRRSLDAYRESLTLQEAEYGPRTAALFHPVYQYGEVLFHLGRLGESLEAFERAIAIGNQDPKLLAGAYFGVARAAPPARRRVAAQKALEIYRKLPPDSVDAEELAQVSKWLRVSADGSRRTNKPSPP